MMIAKHIIVKGLVQGVGFRFFTKRTAGTFGIKGWVRNRPDGTVELFAFAPDENIMGKFIEHLCEGPPTGRVDEVLIEGSEVSADYSGFEIRH